MRALWAGLALGALMAGAPTQAGTPARFHAATQIESARRLATWGQTHRDAPALVLAARMLAEARRGSATAAQGKGWIALARQLADGDQALLAGIAAEVAAMAKERAAR